ncbi:hypothetical protein KJ632_03625 [Patescibacteria group bacterium]|nr:hypothetical protein [Patescibacteria group bacterium]
MATKKNTFEVVVSRVWQGLKEIFGGILRFLQMFFDFLVRLVKVLPEFMKALAWIILACGLVSLIALYSLSVFGIKESEKWQGYREEVLGNWIEHSAKMPAAMELDVE